MIGNVPRQRAIPAISASRASLGCPLGRGRRFAWRGHRLWLRIVRIVASRVSSAAPGVHALRNGGRRLGVQVCHRRQRAELRGEGPCKALATSAPASSRLSRRHRPARRPYERSTRRRDTAHSTPSLCSRGRWEGGQTRRLLPTRQPPPALPTPPQPPIGQDEKRMPARRRAGRASTHTETTLVPEHVTPVHVVPPHTCAGWRVERRQHIARGGTCPVLQTLKQAWSTL